MKKGTSICALAASLALCAPAEAEVLRFVTNTTAQILPASPKGNVDLNGSTAGNQGTSVNLPSARDVIITFMAECAILGDESAWADVDILIKRPADAEYVEVSPTTSDNAFCSGVSAPGDFHNGWVSAATSVGVELPAGVTAIRVRAGAGNVSGGDGSVRIDDLIVTVVD